MSSNTVTEPVAVAVRRLQAFVEEHEAMELERSEPLSAAQIKALETEYCLALPPSYAAFLRAYGTFTVLYSGNELIGMEKPGSLHGAAPDPDDAVDGDDQEVSEAIKEALFFQRIDDIFVENFWCFNPRDRDEDGELGVVAYYHDERFGLPKLLGSKHEQQFKPFHQHIIDVIDDFIESYS